MREVLGCFSEPLLTKEMRRSLLQAVTAAADRTNPSQNDECIPLYPDAVPDLDGHIENLARLVRRVDPRGTHTPDDMPQQMCGVCPHQFPQSYCPLRPHGGCRLYRLASPISAALALEMEKPGLKDAFRDQSERCHG